jgi:hypothetical protein
VVRDPLLAFVADLEQPQCRFLRFCRAAAGFNGFLAAALGLDW